MNALRLCSCVAVLCLLMMPSASFTQEKHLPISALIDDSDFPPLMFMVYGDPASNKELYFDTFGKLAEEYQLDLGTSVEGSVIVRPLADGRAHVSVVIHTAHALCYGYQYDAATDKYLAAFGYSPTRVSQGKEPSLGDGVMTFEYTMPSPETPLTQYWENWESLLAVVNCDGVLREAGSGYPDGTPGRAHTTQRSPRSCPGDCIPIETVEFKRVGK